MKKSLRHILIGVVIILFGTLSALVIADTLNQEKQLLVDGDMETAGVASWGVGGNAALTKESGAVEDGSQVLRIAWIDTLNPTARQSILTVGKTYRVTGWARGDGVNGLPRVYVGGGAPVFTGTTSTDWQYFDVSKESVGVFLSLTMVLDASGYIEFDDILVTEYTPPIVNNEKEILVDGDMEQDGTDIPFTNKFDLTQAANIAADSGVITGALTYTCAGADFDGATDYVTYTIPSTLFSTKPSISIVIEFTPDFAYDVDANVYLFDSTNLHRYLAYKADNAAGNVLTIYLGHVLLANIPSATYSAYWLVDARNVLVISGNGTLTNAWLNGTQILTNDATAWTVKSPTEFAVGASAAGVTNFDGEIHSISIYGGLLDGTDATNLYNSVDTSDWTVGNNACLTKQTGGAEDEKQVIRVTYDGTNNPYARQSVMTSGETYRLTGWARGDGIAYPKIYYSSTGNWQGTTSTDWQYFDENYTTDTTNFSFYALTSAASHVEYDDVLVTEYTPPMVNDYKQLVVDGDMEDAGDPTLIWTAISGATLTKKTGAVDDGAQVIRVAMAAADTVASAGQDVLTVGETYRITGIGRGDGVEGKVAVGDVTTSDLFLGTSSTSWQPFDVTFTAGSIAIMIGVSDNTGAGAYVEFDDIFVTQIN